MRFSVPQYITIEDRLLGLITFRQLFLVLGAFLLTYFAFKLFSVGFSMIVALFAFILAAVFGWVSVNGRPSLNALPKIVEFALKGRRYLWRPTKQLISKPIEVPVVKKYFPLPDEIVPTESLKLPRKIAVAPPPPPPALEKPLEKIKEVKKPAIAAAPIKIQPLTVPSAPATSVSQITEAAPTATAPLPTLAAKIKPPIIEQVVKTEPVQLIPPSAKPQPLPLLQPPQPLIRYIQYAHHHLVNPDNPYRYFPLPTFPKRKW